MRFLFLVSTLLVYFFEIYNTNAEVIKEIKIQGNNNIDSKIILSKLPIKKGKNVSEQDINIALKTLYLDGSFADIEMNVDKKGTLLVNVVESPLISDIYLTGDSHLDIDDVKKELSSKPMQIYSKNKVKFDLDRLYGFYQKMGYLNVKIEPKVVFSENGNTLDLIFNIIEGDLSYVKDIKFYGNNHISSRILLENITSQKRSKFVLSDASGRFEEDNIEKDKSMIKLFYQNKGYAKAEVENSIAGFDKEKYNFTISYFINEGDKYKFKNTSVLCQLPSIQNDKTINQAIKKIKNGQQFSIEAIQSVIAEISLYLGQKGYANITPVYNIETDDDEKTANVEFVLNIKNKVYIDKIFISGNTTTRNNVILRELLVHEGDIYNAVAIAESRDRLYMLGYFKKVDILEHLIPNSDLVSLEIVVEEQFFGNINFSIGYSTYYGIVGSIALQINNLLGYGVNGGINIDRTGFSETYAINLFDPYFFERKRIGLGGSIFFSRFGNLGGGSTMYASYLLSKGYSYGATITASFEILNRLNLSVHLSGSQYIQKMLNASGYLLYQQLIGSRTTISIGYTLTWNQMNRIRYATKGYMVQIGTSFGGLGFIADQHFIKNTFTFASNLQLFGEDLILHFEATAGNVNKLGGNKFMFIGTEQLFSLGGGQSMRGFNYFGIGPRIRRANLIDGTYSDLYYAIQAMNYYYASVELRTPLLIPKDIGVYFNAFVDVGSAFGFTGNLKQATYLYQNAIYRETILDSAMVRVSAGVGINWKSPMGEIGFYYAKPVVKQAYDTVLEFGIRFGSRLY